METTVSTLLIISAFGLEGCAGPIAPQREHVNSGNTDNTGAKENTGSIGSTIAFALPYPEQEALHENVIDL